MNRRQFWTWVVAISLAAGGAYATTEAASGKKKAKGQSASAQVATGAAGQVSQPRAVARPMAIDDDDSSGLFCAGSTPIVHQLGTVPPGFEVTIDFESTDDSDPIAILTTLKMDGIDLGAENGASDDEGGDLNPRFVVRRPYWATYVLAVASADDDEACYTFRTRIRR